MRNTRKILIAAAICSAAYFGVGVYADSYLQDYAFSVLHNTNLGYFWNGLTQRLKVI